MLHDGFVFYSKGSNKGRNGVTEYFKCSKYAAQVNCKAGLNVFEDGRVVVRGVHTCREFIRKQEAESMCINCDDEMKELLEKKALANFRVLPKTVYKEVKDVLVAKYEIRVVIDMLTLEQSKGIVQRARDAITGGDVFRVIEGVPDRHISETDARDFLQFNCAYTQGGELHRVVGFGHPELIKLLEYCGTHVFIDGTFKVAPAPFAQCLIVILYDQAVELYLPVFYILTTARDEWAYWHAFHWLKVTTRMKISPSTVSCDFEWGIIKGVQDEFSDAAIVGCLFHWKQALRKNMLHVRVPVAHIKEAMKPGVLDLLTVVPAKNLAKGIKHVQGLINTDGAKKPWADFWRYFERTWVKSFPFDTWNVSKMLASKIKMINRTNNPLESYNRFFGDMFPVHHPTLLHFLEVIKAEAQEKLRDFNDVRGGVKQPPARPEPAYPSSRRA